MYSGSSNESLSSSGSAEDAHSPASSNRKRQERERSRIFAGETVETKNKGSRGRSSHVIGNYDVT